MQGKMQSLDCILKKCKNELAFSKNAPDDFEKKMDHLANILQFEKLQESFLEERHTKHSNNRGTVQFLPLALNKFA